jgi:hypothetical protein
VRPKSNPSTPLGQSFEVAQDSTLSTIEGSKDVLGLPPRPSPLSVSSFIIGCSTLDIVFAIRCPKDPFGETNGSLCGRTPRGFVDRMPSTFPKIKGLLWTADG